MSRRVLLVVLLAAVVLLLAAIAQAAPIGTLKQFRVPTANANPKEITQGSDGNFWFTESHVQPPQSDNHHIGRITPAGDITEFLVCQFCFPNDIAQGPGGVLYFTRSDPGLGRITTTGEVLSDVVPANTLANGSGITASGNGIYYAAFNTDSIWRYDAVTGAFTEFPIPSPGADPSDVAAAPDGSIWFTEVSTDKLGRLDPATGVITEFSLGGDINGPRQVAVATDGRIWFTKRFSNVVGFLEPATGAVTTFTLASPSGPQGIAPAADGSMWFTQEVAGSVARITAAGTVTEGKRVRGSTPFGVTVAPDGNPWYAELDANKIAVLQLR
jgi:virginiamycin B lyase